MGKYADLQSGIFKLFSGLTWGLENIKTYPQEVVPESSVERHIRISIIPSGPGITKGSVSGICMIDIYTAVATGPSDAMTIADKLDLYLVGKTKITSSGTVQFPLASSLNPRGFDSANPSLLRHTYTVPFTFFGVK